MKHSGILPYFIAMILLFFMAVPVAMAAPSISTISPAVGYTGTSNTVTITGSNFNTTSVKVRLVMDGESSITGTVSSFTATKIVCKFTISSSKETGDWDLVVVNADGSEDSDTFEIRAPIVLTSVSPTSARTNNDAVDFTIVGTGLSYIEDAYLYTSGETNVSASVDDTTSTKVKGTFDLSDVDEDSYKVCVKDDAGTIKCGLTFEVTTDQVGTIDITSSPSGAAVYVDSEYKGTTPRIVDDLDLGSHKVSLQKSGYNEWIKFVKVTEGDNSTVDADLVTATTVTTTVPTTVPTAATTVRTTATRVSTIKVPTSWPTATTPASPVDLSLVIAAAGIGLGLVAIRRR